MREIQRNNSLTAEYIVNVSIADAERDFNVALAGLLLATSATLTSNLVADLAYGWLDPRIRLE